MSWPDRKFSDLVTGPGPQCRVPGISFAVNQGDVTKEKIMKKFMSFILLAAALLFASPALAVDLAWDHDNPTNVTGYTIYYAPTDGSLGPYNITISDGMTMTVNIPDTHFKPNLEFTIYATAYNLTGESEHSDSITYTRHGWGPPPDSVPIKLWIKPGKPKNHRRL
jgi:hypothetical protein